MAEFRCPECSKVIDYGDSYGPSKFGHTWCANAEKYVWMVKVPKAWPWWRRLWA
jgi:hypothetical protein